MGWLDRWPHKLSLILHRNLERYEGEERWEIATDEAIAILWQWFNDHLICNVLQKRVVPLGWLVDILLLLTLFVTGAVTMDDFRAMSVGTWLLSQQNCVCVAFYRHLHHLQATTIPENPAEVSSSDKVVTKPRTRTQSTKCWGMRLSTLLQSRVCSMKTVPGAPDGKSLSLFFWLPFFAFSSLHLVLLDHSIYYWP